uniref:U22 n=1 Tax=Human betaherpesvirus 6 TaxID=10368 RepID=A0A1W6JFA4_9BETA|nr:U22 [Human betaherpesvirus 6]
MVPQGWSLAWVSVLYVSVIASLHIINNENSVFIGTNSETELRHWLIFVKMAQRSGTAWWRMASVPINAYFERDIAFLFNPRCVIETAMGSKILCRYNKNIGVVFVDNDTTCNVSFPSGVQLQLLNQSVMESIRTKTYVVDYARKTTERGDCFISVAFCRKERRRFLPRYERFVYYCISVYLFAVVVFCSCWFALDPLFNMWA